MRLSHEGHGRAQDVPAGHSDMREHYKREPHRRTLLSLGENGDTAAAKCADLSSGSGPEGSPPPRCKEPLVAKALLPLCGRIGCFHVFISV